MADPCQNISREHKIYLNFFIILQIWSGPDIWNSSPWTTNTDLAYTVNSSFKHAIRLSVEQLVNGGTARKQQSIKYISTMTDIVLKKVFIPEQQKCPAYKHQSCQYLLES